MEITYTRTLVFYEDEDDKIVKENTLSSIDELQDKMTDDFNDRDCKIEEVTIMFDDKLEVYLTAGIVNIYYKDYQLNKYRILEAACDYPDLIKKLTEYY